MGVVGDESPRRLRQMAPRPLGPRPLGSLRARKAALEDHARILQARGLDVSVVVRFGCPSAEIATELKRGGHDLVLKMANPDESASSWRFTGDTAVRLMRRAPVPMWVTRRRNERATRILAAIDPIGEPARRALDDEVMALARKLAESQGGELHVVHAWDTVVLKGRVSWQEARRYAAVTYRSICRDLDEYLARYEDLLGGPCAAGSGNDRERVRDAIERVHTPRGAPEIVIPQTAARIGADVVVMGNFGRTGLSGYLIGNTAEKVLARLDASIIAVKPGSLGLQDRSVAEPARSAGSVVR